MKKSVCLMAILGAFAATGAMATTDKDQTVDVTFTGNIVDSNCNIALDNGNLTLELGSVNKKTLADVKKGARVPVTFKLNQCNGMTLKSLDLVQATNGAYPENFNDTNATLPTEQADLVVQIYQEKAGTTKGLADLSGVTDANGAITEENKLINVGYAALALKDGGNVKNLTAGAVSSSAMFRFEFN